MKNKVLIYKVRNDQEIIPKRKYTKRNNIVKDESDEKINATKNGDEYLSNRGQTSSKVTTSKQYAANKGTATEESVSNSTSSVLHVKWGRLSPTPDGCGLVYKLTREKNPAIVANPAPQVVTSTVRPQVKQSAVKQRQPYRKQGGAKTASKRGSQDRFNHVPFQNPLGDLDLDEIEASCADGGYAPFQDVTQVMAEFHRTVEANTPRSAMRIFHGCYRSDTGSNTSTCLRPIAYCDEMLVHSTEARQQCGSGDYHPSYLYDDLVSFMLEDNMDRLQAVTYPKLALDGATTSADMGVSTATHATSCGAGSAGIVRPVPIRPNGYGPRNDVTDEERFAESAYRFAPIRAHTAQNGYSDEFLNCDSVTRLQYVAIRRDESGTANLAEVATGTLTADLSDQMRAGDPIYVPLYDEACRVVEMGGDSVDENAHLSTHIDPSQLPPYAPSAPNCRLLRDVTQVRAHVIRL